MCRAATRKDAKSGHFSLLRAFCAALGLALLPTLPSCSVAAYGFGVATMVNDMKVREREDYESYRKQAEATNAARVRDGLPKEQIMTFRQWTRQNSR